MKVGFNFYLTMYKIFLLIVLPCVCTLAQSPTGNLTQKQSDKIIIGNRVYLNPYIATPWNKDSITNFIRAIDEGLERFKDGFACNYNEPLANSYNSLEKLILVNFLENRNGNAKIFFAFPMYIVQKKKEGIDADIFLFEISKATKKNQRKYKSYLSKIQGGVISYTYNNLMFEIRPFSQIPEPIKIMIHANY